MEKKLEKCPLQILASNIIQTTEYKAVYVLETIRLSIKSVC
jgi:hypothetical protein